MSNSKVVMSQAANTLTAPLEVEDVFSTYLYEGNSSTQTITNGIDLDGEGGLVWQKRRSSTGHHFVMDTERNPNSFIYTNLTSGEGVGTSGSSFNSDGFTIGAENNLHNTNDDVASWTFRKAPKFFDVVTYTGNFSSQTIPHNLGTTPGTIIIKRTDSTSYWIVYHRSLGNTQGLVLDLSDGAFSSASIWDSTSPDENNFYIGGNNNHNVNGGTYVAYLFAHNDGDGEFGPDGDADIIKCGSYTTDGSEEATINLGFEPQWLLVKRTDATGGSDWRVIDSMRGWEADGDAAYVEPNTSDAEAQTGDGRYYLTSTGFKQDNFGANRDYIYIAIRRGTKVPESGTEVFDIATRDATHPSFDASFDVVDAAINRNTSGAYNWFAYARLIGQKYLQPNLTNAENTGAAIEWDHMDGWSNGSGTLADLYSWMWKRAPNFFDVVAYTGDGVAGRTVSHNLGVAPEMIWVKRRSATGGWGVYHKTLGASAYLVLQGTNAAITGNSFPWNDTAPTESVFTLGSGFTNQSSSTYIAYLFASLDGVSKVGSYTGNGTSQTIDCGFTSGARFILVKRTDSTGDWYIWDTERGIVAGNDPYLELNTSDAEVTSTDWVDPDNSGFIVNGTTINASSAEYIFYAIA